MLPFCFFLTALITFSIESRAQNASCVELFLKEPDVAAATLFPPSLGISKEVEDLVLSGPFQEVALELIELSLQIETSQFVKDLSHAFKTTRYDLTPELRSNSNWYVWKAQLQLQHPHLSLSQEDWVRLWNIYSVLHQQFSKDWSQAQLTWITTWLLEIVNMDHFQLEKTLQLNQMKGPLWTLQDPILTHVYTKLINDPVFKQYLLAWKNRILILYSLVFVEVSLLRFERFH